MAQLHCAEAEVGDWEAVARGIVHHGLVGLAAPALLRAKAAPAATLAALDAERSPHVVGVMSRLFELVRIARALKAARIRHLFIKGIALSIQLYGDPVMRAGRDIDVLVERSRIRDAEAILLDLGYELPTHCTAAAEPTEGEPPKESGWVHGESRILVELHDRLCDNHALLPWDFEMLWTERETVTIGGMTVPTMARRRLPVYLAVHGIRHGWQRLLWLIDLAALLDRDAAWDDALDDAAALGLEGMMLHVGWALHHWLARPVPSDVLARGRRRLEVRLLNRLVARFHNGPRWYEMAPRGSVRRFIDGSVWSRSITYTMKPTRAFWSSQLAFDLSSPQDRAAFALPARLGWMYPLIRPFGWAIRRLR
ncbi:nucleotidyltransferase family protein [Sphingomonas sp. R647]|nr:nucleotidyltransferase family protein [Sphingomonas sp. R647]